MLEEEFGVAADEAPKEPQKLKKRIYPKRLGKDNAMEVVRVMPPMKSLKNFGGGWIKYIVLHWGFRSALLKEKDKTYALVFICPRTFDRHADCSLCDEITNKEETLANLESRCAKEGRSAEETLTLVTPLKEWLKTYNRDGGWYMNVMNQKGEFYPLKINNTTKKSLDDEFRKYGKAFCTDVNKGLWFKFEFYNNGKNNKVEVVQEPVTLPDGSVAYKNKLAPLTDTQKRQALEDCQDLAVDIARTLSPSKIRMLTACSGDPEEVSAIVNLAEKVESSLIETAAGSTPKMSDEEFLNQYRGQGQ